MTTLEQFIQDNGLVADVEPADSNPNMEGQWASDASHWNVTISSRLHDATMSVPFSQGSAHTKPPTLEDVLDCLASDASSVEQSGSFDDWASDMGFFPMESADDFRRAERIYQAIETQSKALRDLLGEDAYQTFLYDTERL